VLSLYAPLGMNLSLSAPCMSETRREFALSVVKTLREAGYQALWAGGCVRDELLGRTPKDYDVATNAPPERVRRLFGRHRTLTIGAAFGVVALLGPREVGSIEVATFRRDAAYSDGRHPDHVTYGTAEEDAERRDFTINGMFLDPLTNQLYDFVGGQRDLEEGVIRAIGNPHQRIAEDKLRMLRAIRFAARFDFRLDPDCLRVIQQRAEEIRMVSAERIGAELRCMFLHPSRHQAARLLIDSRLLPVLLPEGNRDYHWGEPGTDEKFSWRISLEILNALGVLENVTPAFAALLRGVCSPQSQLPLSVENLGKRWRLTNAEVEGVHHLLRYEETILDARQLPWSQLQRLLIAPHADDLLRYCEAVAVVRQTGERDVNYCYERLTLPLEQLNPAPLLTGNDLRHLGLPPGPRYRTLLTAIRDHQLDGRLTTSAEALDWVRQQLAKTSKPELT
jgi:poly(A) polymerase